MVSTATKDSTGANITRSSMPITVNNNTVSWYNINSGWQFNENGLTYCYVVFG